MGTTTAASTVRRGGGRPRPAGDHRRPRYASQPGAGRILLGVLVGLLVGFIASFLPGFLYAVLTGRNLDLPAGVLGLLLLVAVPLGGVLGGLRAAPRTMR
jgi:hypothetical protein